MLIKLYGLSWAAFLVVAGFLFVGGFLTEMAVVVLGFVAFGLVFMGMIGVLPSSVGHNAPHAPEPAKAVAPEPALRKSAKRVEQATV